MFPAEIDADDFRICDRCHLGITCLCATAIDDTFNSIMIRWYIIDSTQSDCLKAASTLCVVTHRYVNLKMSVARSTKRNVNNGIIMQSTQ